MAAETSPAPFDRLLGVEYLELGPERATARLPLRDDLSQPFGALHGGVHSALAESLTSIATLEAVRADGMIALGQAIETKFLRTIDSGHLNAEARLRHRGRTTWIWDVELTDDDGRLCALARMTVALRPAKD